MKAIVAAAVKEQRNRHLICPLPLGKHAIRTGRIMFYMNNSYFLHFRLLLAIQLSLHSSAYDIILNFICQGYTVGHVHVHATVKEYLAYLSTHTTCK